MKFASQRRKSRLRNIHPRILPFFFYPVEAQINRKRGHSPPSPSFQFQTSPLSKVVCSLPHRNHERMCQYLFPPSTTSSAPPHQFVFRFATPSANLSSPAAGGSSLILVRSSQSATHATIAVSSTFSFLLLFLLLLLQSWVPLPSLLCFTNQAIPPSPDADGGCISFSLPLFSVLCGMRAQNTQYPTNNQPTFKAQQNQQTRPNTPEMGPDRVPRPTCERGCVHEYSAGRHGGVY